MVLGIGQLFITYAKEGIFLALFLYLLIWNIPKIREEFKEDMKNMEERHGKAIDRVEKRYTDELEKVEKKSEKRESELMNLLRLLGDKYDIITHKVDEVLKKLER
jgi:hypothetical protein